MVYANPTAEILVFRCPPSRRKTYRAPEGHVAEVVQLSFLAAFFKKPKRTSIVEAWRDEAKTFVKDTAPHFVPTLQKAEIPRRTVLTELDKEKLAEETFLAVQALYSAEMCAEDSEQRKDLSLARELLRDLSERVFHAPLDEEAPHPYGNSVKPLPRGVEDALPRFKVNVKTITFTLQGFYNRLDGDEDTNLRARLYNVMTKLHLYTQHRERGA